MAKQFLITRPRYDLGTSYLHSFSKEIVKGIRSNRAIHLIDLEGDKANRENLINKLPVAGLIFLNGHGNSESVFGHKDEIILDKNNIGLTKGKIVYALACDSLVELGEVAVKKERARAYIGYRSSFMLVRDPSRTSSPDKDRSALPFRKVCSVLIDSLISGEAVSKAIEKTKKEYASAIKFYGTSEDDPYGDTPLIRFALTWDLEYLDMCGDGNAAF